MGANNHGALSIKVLVDTSLGGLFLQDACIELVMAFSESPVFGAGLHLRWRANRAVGGQVGAYTGVYT